jgi:hypothetical protein
MQTSQRSTLGLMDRALIGMLLFIVILLFGIEAARAAEIVPSIGITKAIDNPGGSAKTFGGLALRTTLAPMVKAEIGGAYRSESYLNGDLTLRMVPLTASLWASPLPMLYAGGGVGMYITTLGYREALALPDQTTKKFGVHLGGGMSFPIAPMASVDLNGRYVFMEKQASQLPPNEFNPDFWSTSLGLALKF